MSSNHVPCEVRILSGQWGADGHLAGTLTLTVLWEWGATGHAEDESVHPSHSVPTGIPDSQAYMLRK